TGRRCRYILSAALQKYDVAQAHRCGPLLRKPEHFGADVHRSDSLVGHHRGGRPDRDRARSGAGIEHLLTRPQRRPPDYAVDDLTESIIDFSEIGRRHAIPYADLPLQCCLLAVAAHHGNPPRPQSLFANLVSPGVSSSRAGAAAGYSAANTRRL